MGVIRRSLGPEPPDDQLLDPAVIAKLGSPLLQSKRNEFRRKQEDLRFDIMIKLASAANSIHPLSMVAKTMGISERELKDLITLSAVETDQAAIMTFFSLATSNRQSLKELTAQLEAFGKAGQIYKTLRRELMRREREAREREILRHEQEAMEMLMSKKAEQEPAMPVKIAIPDVPGHDHKPDPLDADSPEEFVDTMRRYRIWAGNPSLRVMAHRCNQRFSHTTFGNALKASTLPGFDMVDAFITVLGGTAEDKSRWVTAWRSFAVPQLTAGNRNVAPLRLTGS